MHQAGGKTFKTFPFWAKGAFRGTAWFDKNNMLRGVNSTMFNPVYGDIPVRTVYSGHKILNGVKFPTRIKDSSAGFPTLDVTINLVKVNVAAKITAPKGLRRDGGRVAMEKAADSVWHVRGGSHHSVAIEMQDHVSMVEAPLGDGRTKAVLREVRKTIPGKSIQTVLNTHLHFDHSGGLRAAATEGILIASFRDNVKFFKTAYDDKNSIKPDAYATSGKRAKFIAVSDKHVFTDGAVRWKCTVWSAMSTISGSICHLLAERQDPERRRCLWWGRPLQDTREESERFHRQFVGVLRC